MIAAAVLSCSGGSHEARTRAPEARPPAPASPLAADAVRGVSDAELAALLRDHWEHTMRSSPVWATTLGDHRFDDKLGDASHQAVLDAREVRAGFLERARAIDPARLDARDRINLALLTEELAAAAAAEVCDAHLWSVSTFESPISGFNHLPERHKIAGDADARNLLARYRQIPAQIDAVIANLRRGAAAGMFGNAQSIKLAIELADRELARPLEDWALLGPLAADRLAPLSEGYRQRFARELRQVVAAEIKPAFARYRELLASEIAPRARRADKVGIGALPQGPQCYAARITSYLGIERTPAQLHQLGLAEIKRINGEMTRLGAGLFGTGELAAVIARLRTDPKLYYREAETIVADAEKALAAARRAIPKYFGILPATDCVVVPIPDYEAPFSTIAYYRQPHADGSKPGEYFINTYKPEVRPRFEARVLAFHESIPGHHLQIAISQERSELPAFRRFGGSTAFVEGWALYTERLAGEMGLYETDLDRMGMLSYDAWRASRLVVDTGIHAMGWTREKAERFLRDHTALTETNIVNEVDRYISWPGQALAYKVGQLEIVALRGQAEKNLGDRFDIKAFHDVVLGSGAVSLPVLRDNVERWIASIER